MIPMADEAALRQQLSQTMAALYQRGWCDGTGGNFSVVLQHEPLQLLMAPSGVPKGDVRPEQLIVVDAQGQVMAGAGRASAETLLHLEIVNGCGAGAVLHTHSQAATLLSSRLARTHAAELLLSDLEMLKGLRGITTHETTVAVPVLPNRQNLVQLSAEARPLLGQAPFGLLIAGHGLYAWGSDLQEAHRHLEILEFLLEQRWRQLLLDPDALQPHLIEGISHVVLDIEGTTCPVSFVSEVLFPYATSHLNAYLQEHKHDEALQRLLSEVDQLWRNDGDAHAAGLHWQAGAETARYLHWLIAQDRKCTPLKDLQGQIWQQGYACGQLRGSLFGDVAPALHRWHRDGTQLAVYSSGSVPAQQLLYGHTETGDLRRLFSHWFDTRSGPKREASSYRTVAEAMDVEPERVLFISDSSGELRAASLAGMRTLFSDRPGNPDRDPAGFERITAFSCLQISR